MEKITFDQVREIRLYAENEYSAEDIAEYFGLSLSHTQALIRHEKRVVHNFENDA